jgi:iron complex outermembrane receptor protein
MKKSLLLLFILLDSIVLISAEDNKWKVEGQVRDENGQALSGASVIIKGTYLGAYTGRDGAFSFKSVVEGEYILRVSYMGYESEEREISVKSDLKLDIELSISTLESDEILIKGMRASGTTPVAYTNLKSDELKKINTGQDLPYLLSLVPSVVETSEGGAGIGYTGIRIRGTDASRINVTIDGIPLNDSESQQVFWVNTPDLVASVSEIQVQRGVGTSTNGAGSFGGSINLTMENPSDDPYASISSTVGSFNTIKTSVKLGTGYIKDKFKMDIRFSGLNSNGYIDRARSDLRSYEVSALYRLKSSILKANFIYGEQLTGISWWGVPADSLATNRTYNPAGEYIDLYGNRRYHYDQTDNYEQTHFHLMYNWQISDKLFLKTAGHFTVGSGYYEQYKEDALLADYNLPVWILHGLFEDVYIDRSDLIRRKWLYNNYYGGVFNLNYKDTRLELSFGGAINRYVGDHFGRIMWMRFAGTTEINHQWYFNGGQKDEVNIYTKLNYRLNDRLSLYGDLQYRYINYEMGGIDDDLRILWVSEKFNFLNPKAGMFFSLNSHNDLYLSLAVGNKEPTRANYKDASGDESAKPVPETLYDFEGGYELKLSRVSAGLNLYYMLYDNQLVPTGKLSNVGYPIMTNVEDSYRAGLEFSFGVRPSDLFDFAGSITLSQNRIKNFVEYSSNYNSISDIYEEISVNHGDVNIAYSPSVIGSGILTIHPLKDFDVSIVSKYVGKQYFDNTQNEGRVIDPYVVNNLRLDYAFSIAGLSDVSLQLQVNNLINSMYVSNAYGGNWYEDMQEYSWAYYFPQAGINYLLRLTLNF